MGSHHYDYGYLVKEEGTKKKKKKNRKRKKIRKRKKKKKEKEKRKKKKNSRRTRLLDVKKDKEGKLSRRYVWLTLLLNGHILYCPSKILSITATLMVIGIIL